MKNHKRKIVKIFIDKSKLEEYLKNNPNLSELKINDDTGYVSFVVDQECYKNPFKYDQNGIVFFVKDTLIKSKEGEFLSKLCSIFKNEIMKEYSLSGETELEEKSSNIQNIRYFGKRVETGVLKFGDDHAGVFFRGDHALYNANVLSEILVMLKDVDSEISPINLGVMEGMIKTLQSCQNK